MRRLFPAVLIVVQLVFVVMFAVLVDYGDEALPKLSPAALEYFYGITFDEPMSSIAPAGVAYNLSDVKGDDITTMKSSKLATGVGSLIINTTEKELTTVYQSTASVKPTDGIPAPSPQADANYDAMMGEAAVGKENQENSLTYFYPMFQDVHVMMFIGFGFLMTFLKKYGLSSVGYNFLIASFVIQWATLISGLFHLPQSKTGKIPVDITTMITADFACATVLISFGAVLGKTTPIQLMIMAFLETFFFALNEWIGADIFQAVDIGGSMFVHLFGAFFGLSVSRVLYKDIIKNHENLGSSNQSDMLSILGTIFLWVFWPSFNSALAVGDQQQRAVINTYYSLAACCVTTFAMSILMDKEKKGELDMVHIQNSTLAGGVAVGSIANMIIHVWGAIFTGFEAAITSIIGFRYITPYIEKKWNIHDTCGVLNLHGMPAIMAGTSSVVYAVFTMFTPYGFSLFQVFPAMTPVANSSDFAIVEAELPGIHPGLGRSAGVQAGFQMAALTVTMFMAIVSGILVGFIIKIPLFYDDLKTEEYYHDSKYWKNEYVPSGSTSQNDYVSVPLEAPGNSKEEQNSNIVLEDENKAADESKV